MAITTEFTPWLLVSWVAPPIITGVICWVLANRKNNQETEAKKLEREMILRKEVFLETAESLQKIARYLASFANMGLSNDEHMKSYESTLGSIGKMHLIAKDETLQALIKANNYLFHIDTLLWQARNETAELQRELGDIHKDARQSKEFAAAKIKYLDAHLDLVELALTSSFNYGCLLIDVVVAARHELDLPLDMEAYRLTMRNSYDAARATVQKQIKEEKQKLGLA